ncbi:MAG: MFS transporter [Actinomycetota bacterium]
MPATVVPNQAALRVFLRSGFVWQLCWSSYWTLLFLRVVVDVGLDPLQLLLLGTVKEVTILLSEIPTGVIADIRSRRQSVIIAFVVCGIAAIGAGLADTFLTLAVTQAVWAFGTTFRSGAETAWFTDEVGSLAVVDAVLPRRGRIESIGSVVGLLGTAGLAATTSLGLALVTVGVLLVGWALMLIGSMPETGFERLDVSARGRFRQLLGEGFTAARLPGLRVLLIATVMAGFASEAVDRLRVARLDRIELQDQPIDPALVMGSTAVLQSLGAALTLSLIATMLAGRRLVTAYAWLHLGAAAGVAVLALVGELWLALGGVLATGMMREVATTVKVGWTNHFTDRHNRATVHSFAGQAGSVGEISGGIVLGFVAREVGIDVALVVSAVVYAAAALVSTAGRPRWRKTV